MGKAAIQAMSDATLDIPSTPHWTGALRGSGSVFVNNKNIATSPDPSNGKGSPATVLGDSVSPNEIVGAVGFNTEYAARMHEGVHLNFKTAGTGAKFLSTKFVTNNNRYMQIITNEINKP